MHAPKQFVTDVSSLGGLPVFLLVIVAVPERALQMLVALAISMVIVVPIRIVWPRERPEKREARNLIERIDASSFPSIHTARAAIASLAIVSAPWMYVIAAVVIASVGAARVRLKAHDVLDVSAGAVLGIGTWFAAGLIMGALA